MEESIVSKILSDLYLPAFLEAMKPGPLTEILSAEMKSRIEADEQWLASLSAHDRKVELNRRRIAVAEGRFAAVMDFRRGECW